MELIVVHHSHERFGDFRSTLLGLMSAYNYERNILHSVGQLMNSDAYRALMACYKRHRHAYRPEVCEPSAASTDETKNGGDNGDGGRGPFVTEGENNRVGWLMSGNKFEPREAAVNKRDEMCLVPGGKPLKIGLSRGR